MKNIDGLEAFDAYFIKSCMEKMDKDVATRFVLSGLSLDKTKIEDAFTLACQEMQIRTEEAAKKTNNSTEKVNEKTTDELFSSKGVLKLVEELLSTPKTKKNK